MYVFLDEVVSQPSTDWSLWVHFTAQLWPLARTSGLQRVSPKASRLPAFPRVAFGLLVWRVFTGWVSGLQRVSPKASRLPAVPRVALAVPSGHRSLFETLTAHGSLCSPFAVRDAHAVRVSLCSRLARDGARSRPCRSLPRRFAPRCSRPPPRRVLASGARTTGGSPRKANGERSADD